MATEQPAFDVIKKDGNVELREYSGYVLASVMTSADSHATAGSQGFSPLAGYIFGDNVARRRMSMTVPVITTKQETSVKLPMIAPVISQARGSHSYSVSFVMPSNYNIEDLPIPTDGDIQLSTIEKHRALVISFSGYARESLIEKNTQKLKEWAQKNKIISLGEPLLARYDAPWKPGFLRHNEIMIICK